MDTFQIPAKCLKGHYYLETLCVPKRKKRLKFSLDLNKLKTAFINMTRHYVHAIIEYLKECRHSKYSC